MYGTKIKNYANDLKGLLFLLGIIFVTIVWNWDYLFSENTFDSVKVVEKKDIDNPKTDLILEKK